MISPKLEAAKKMAASHFRVDQQVRQIFLIHPLCDEDPTEPIKLLEVVEGTLERGIEPISFCPDPARGIEYPSVIVEVSPREFKALRDKSPSIGFEDWTIGEELLAG